MTNCTQKPFSLLLLKRRTIQVELSGGNITSDGGFLLLRQMDKQLGLLEAVDRAAVLPIWKALYNYLAFRTTKLPFPDTS